MRRTGYLRTVLRGEEGILLFPSVYLIGVSGITLALIAPEWGLTLLQRSVGG